jgi:Zn-finger nucleic acid-binding protein
VLVDDAPEGRRERTGLEDHLDVVCGRHGEGDTAAAGSRSTRDPVKLRGAIADERDAPSCAGEPGIVHLVACSRCHAQFDVAAVAGESILCHCGARVEVTRPTPIDAPIRRCGACGAGVDPQDVTCGFCRSRIDREAARGLVCPECYARNADASRHCTNCGVQFQPQPLLHEAEPMACPACELPLAVRSIADVAVSECGSCRGLWVPGESFDTLVERARARHQTRASDGLDDGSRPAPRVTGTVSYRRCPVGREVMHRKNFGRSSGVIVDWCRAHGTWLDADELGRIAAFIAGGGLAVPTVDPRLDAEAPCDVVREADRLMREARRSHREPSLAEFLLRIIA